MLLAAALEAFVAVAAAEDPYADARARMIETIEAHARSATDALGRDYIDPRVLAVMNQVPRHEFVSGWYENQARTRIARCRLATARPSRNRSSSP